MKGTSNATPKEFVALNFGGAGGAANAITYYATEAEALDYAARTVAANKGGEVLVYKIASITKLPTPAVEVMKVDVTDVKA